MHFMLSNDGGTAIVEFEWAACSYNVMEMFKEELESGAIKDYHPKIAAIKSELEQVLDSTGVAPKGYVKVKLPINVQTDTSTWTKSWAYGERMVPFW